MSFLTRHAMPVMLFALVECAGAEVTTLDTMFPGRGWFDNSGQHMALNDNTSTGSAGELSFRSFYVWDTSGLVGATILSAELQLGSDAFFGNLVPIAFSIFDVSTSRTALVADYAPGDATGLAIFSDLGSGNLYGGFSVTEVAPTVWVALLNDAALADLVAAVPSGEFAIGLSRTGGAEGIVRFEQTPRIQRLVVTTTSAIPEPGTFLMLGLGLVAVACARLRRPR